MSLLRAYAHWLQFTISLIGVSLLVAVCANCGSGVGTYTPPPALAKPKLELRNTYGVAQSLSFGSAGNWLEAATDKGSIDLWDPVAGTSLTSLDPKRGPVRGTAISADGTLLASSYKDRSVAIWDLTKKEIVRNLDGAQAESKALAFSSDGRWVASADQDNSVAVWQTSGKRLRSLNGHGARINSLAFLPGTPLLASASNDATIRIWNAETGALVKTLTGHDSPVRSLNFSPDGDCLASGGAAQYQKSIKNSTSQLRIWDTKNWNEVRQFSSIMGDVNCVVFRPDSKRLAASNGSDFSTEIVTIDTAQWQETGAWNAHHSNLTAGV